jgi:hypothetical protein
LQSTRVAVTDDASNSDVTESAIPPPESGEFDAVIDTVAAGGRVTAETTPDEGDDADGADGDVGHATIETRAWKRFVAHRLLLTWIAPSILAFVIGASATVWMVRQFEPATTPAPLRAARPSPMPDRRGVPTSENEAPPTARPVAPSPAVETATATPEPVAVPAPGDDALARTSGPPVSEPLASVGLSATSLPVATTGGTNGGTSNGTNGGLRANRPTPAPRPDTPRPDTPLPDAPVAARAAAAAAIPDASLPPIPNALPVIVLTAPSGVEPTPPPAATAVAAAVPAPVAAAMAESGVRAAIGRYEAAFEQMDVEAAAEVWPSVDRRALARAFDTLESQGLTLDTCDVEVDGTSGRAHCTGRIQFVRKFGSATPRVSPQQWLFKVRKLGEAWIIGEVTASNATSSSIAAIR